MVSVQSCKKAAGTRVSPVRRFTICEVGEEGLVAHLLLYVSTNAKRTVQSTD